MPSRQEIIDVSKFFKVISDPTRLTILFLLRKESLNVTEIVNYVEMEQSAVSHQLRILRESRLVKSERQGKTVRYQLLDEHVFDILDQVLDHIRE
ncbi:transcriptional regulator [Suicoccus acidiformans]|uniref:Transcriptional regulator n=1 Tax=Suicoccus acidiformans TaxID=2036206 RepID=A0A347WL52_9LACT|nr:metalloregulator ArsR/SmtB family transcription factor [Suicoccus acidiformans]AXY25809.1 transcriptional regulator [Suicoccus acidiformans]